LDSKPVSFEWIETLPALEGAVRTLEQAEIIGVDLEADSLHHYFEKICLLQIAAESVTLVLDTLALKDLSALGPVFSNPGIRKVFHGADYDIRSLHRNFGLEVANLFDTQLAGRFLGLKETGLEAMLRSRFQVELNKKFQRADWSRRPLSREMLDYAAMDSSYLIPLARMLEKELEEKGRLSWVEEECRYLAQVRFLPLNPGPRYLKVKGASRLDPEGLAVLEALLEFREAEARKQDRPPFKVFGNEPLLELARQKPMSLEEMEAGKALSRKQFSRYGKGLLQEIEKALALPEPHLPRRQGGAKKPNLSKPAQRKIESLKRWRARRAEDLGLEPGLFSNNALIQDLALKDPQSPAEMEKIPGMKTWLKDHFGQEIREVLKSGG
jgi:ribonuclease D